MKTEQQPTEVDPDDIGTRRGHRFNIRGHMTRVIVSVPNADGESIEYRGRLENLSYGGAKLSLNGKVPNGTEVDVKIVVASMDLVLNRAAIVRWQQPRDAASWWIGIEVAKNFSDDFIDDLAEADVLDRRVDQRYQVSKHAIIRSELDIDGEEVTIVNFSKGGFCLKLSESRTSLEEQRLMVSLDGEGEIPARVMWFTTREDGCYVGCSYFTGDGFKLMRSYAEPKRLARQRARKHKSWVFRPMSKWMAIAVVVLACVESIRLLNRRPEALSAAKETATDLWQNYVDGPIRSQLQRLEE